VFEFGGLHFVGRKDARVNAARSKRKPGRRRLASRAISKRRVPGAGGDHECGFIGPEAACEGEGVRVCERFSPGKPTMKKELTLMPSARSFAATGRHAVEREWFADDVAFDVGVAAFDGECDLIAAAFAHEFEEGVVDRPDGEAVGHAPGDAEFALDEAVEDGGAVGAVEGEVVVFEFDFADAEAIDKRWISSSTLAGERLR